MPALANQIAKRYEGKKVILKGNFAISDIDISIFLFFIVVVVVVVFLLHVNT